MNKKSNFLKNFVLRGISVFIIVIISMTSIVFAGEHTVNNWDDYKEVIIEDIMKQEEVIKVSYIGEKKFNSLEEINNCVVNLYNEARENIPFSFINKNIHKTQLSRSAFQVSGGYLLNYGLYNITYKNLKDDIDEVQRQINNFINNNINDNMTDYEKIRLAYEYVIDSYYYDDFAKNNDDLESILRERNMLLGLNGQGVVCDAYAMFFSMIVTSLRYDNLIVSGTVNGGNHAWNLVNINNSWYHVDTNWGDIEIEQMIEELIKDNSGIDEEIIRKLVEEEAEKKKELYFLTSDDVLKTNNHNWNSNNYPFAYEVYENIELKQNLEEIILAIEIAEEVKSQESIDYARNLVNQLEDSENRNSLNIRLDVIQTGIDYLLQLEGIIEAVEIAENSRLQEDVDYAINLVNELKNSENKDDLNNRLNIIQAEIDEQFFYKENIENKIKNMINLFEADKIQEDINSLLNEQNKDNLQQKFNSKVNELRNESSDGFLEGAIEAVEIAENTLDKNSYDYAKGLVDDLFYCEKKEDLLSRLDVVKKEIEIQVLNNARIEKEAIQAISLAEVLKREPYIEKAKNAVELLEDKELKRNLENRLAKFNIIFIENDKNNTSNITDNSKNNTELIKSVENALKLAETLKREPYITKAEEEINKFEDSIMKNDFEKRLVNLKKLLNLNNSNKNDVNSQSAIKLAENAIKLAEILKREPYITNAKEAVELLNFDNNKEQLLIRLNILIKNIE